MDSPRPDHAASPASAAARGVRRALSSRAGWMRILTYALFIFSSFTIAGSETACILLLALGLWQAAGRLRRGPPLPALPWWLLAPLLGLLAVTLLSALANPNVLATLDHTRLHYRPLVPFALAAALGLVSLQRLWRTHWVFMALFVVYGLIQFRYGVDWFRPEGAKLTTPYPYSPGWFHAKGEFTHHITYGGVMLMNCVLYAALALEERGRPRWLWASGSLLAAIATAVSLARSAWLGLFVGMAVLIVMRLPRRWAVTLGVAALLVVIGVGWAVATASLRQFVHEDSPAIVKRLFLTSPIQDQERIHLWEAGLLAIRDRPWLGAGMGNADPTLGPYRDLIAKKYDVTWGVSLGAGVHNIYLQVVFNLGWVGLATYLSLWAALFVWTARALRALRTLPPPLPPTLPLERGILLGAMAAWVGSMAAGWFENNAYDKMVQTTLVMLIGMALHLGLKYRRQTA